MTEKSKIQNWDDSFALGNQGVKEVAEFLHSEIVQKIWHPTELIHSIEADSRYQVRGIDLLWVIPVENYLKCLTIEVKTDRNHHTGNFFFETVSVEERDKPGAFVITRAEWLFYYFIVTKEIFCFPISALKPWFYAHESEFVERRSQSIRASSKSNSKLIEWSTIGRLVPISRVLAEVAEVKRFQKKTDKWIVVS